MLQHCHMAVWFSCGRNHFFTQKIKAMKIGGTMSFIFATVTEKSLRKVGTCEKASKDPTKIVNQNSRCIFFPDDTISYIVADTKGRTAQISTASEYKVCYKNQKWGGTNFSS